MSDIIVNYKNEHDLHDKIMECNNRLQNLNKQRNTEFQRLSILLSKMRYEKSKTNSGLCNDEIKRYSRQLILPSVATDGQIKLKNTSFLVVGMGGLGCPAAQYLVAAGCGRVGLLDYDNVEISNLPRQILYKDYHIGVDKVTAAALSLREMNDYCNVEMHNVMLKSDNASEIIQDYDIILDCTDNGPTRYLLNDTCVQLNKPLISGSALQMDGQLAVYNYGEDGLCYRCLHEVPPPASMVRNCSDGGILGPVTGVIGCLQAIEAIKIALNGMGGVVQSQRLLLFDGLQGSFRSIKLRSRRENCTGCSKKAIGTENIDYEKFCGIAACDKDYTLTLLASKDRISVDTYSTKLSKQPHVLIDVRDPIELKICKLPDTINIPLQSIMNDSFLLKWQDEIKDESIPIVVVCRRGNDSQIAVHHMRTKLPKHNIKDLEGGLHAWHYNIDQNFPIY